MRGVYHKSAAILNTRGTSSDASTGTVTVAAVAKEYWVARRLWVSNNASGATDFDNLLSIVSVNIQINGVTVWEVNLHPGNGGTGSLEFNAGPWQFDLSPGLYTGTKNETLVVNVGSFGTDMKSLIELLYQ